MLPRNNRQPRSAIGVRSACEATGAECGGLAPPPSAGEPSFEGRNPRLQLAPLAGHSAYSAEGEGFEPSMDQNGP